MACVKNIEQTFATACGRASGANDFRFAIVREVARHLGVRSARALRQYGRNEDGSFIIFGLFTFVMLLVLAGIGVDVIRHETLRAELQNTLDRAVFAAANLETPGDAQAIVTDYFNKAGLTPYLEDVQVSDVDMERRVKATVTADIPTYFLKFSGINNLILNGIGAAEQDATELEIAMVLDVSGSMNRSERLPNLDRAGRAFAETVFENSGSENVTISVVPYATQVNVGPTILSTLDRMNAHETSHCLNFVAEDFITTFIAFKHNKVGKSYEQTLNFDPWTYGEPNDGLTMEVCNPNPKNTVLPFSHSLTEVTDKISGLVADGNTSIDVGVKWGAALLDPSSRPITQALIAAHETDASNAGRPHDFSSSTLKVMVVMTDGVNTTQYRMPDAYRSGLSDIWVAPDNLVSFETTQNSCSWWSGCRSSTRYYTPHNESYQTTPHGGDAARLLTWPEVWDRFTIESHAYTRSEASGNKNDYYNWRNWTKKGVENTAKNARLSAACTAAKDQGILVFTIGFEAPDGAAKILRDCASSPAHYFNADGLEIADAFAAVATTITKLRVIE